MTGLDVDKSTLVEIACIVTEGNTQLDIVAEVGRWIHHFPLNDVSGSRHRYSSVRRSTRSDGRMVHENVYKGLRSSYDMIVVFRMVC